MRQDKLKFDSGKLEERKMKEIEHSRIRRSILQGFERKIDTNVSEKVKNADKLILNKGDFEKHFSNAKFYSITASSEAHLNAWLKQKCSQGVTVLDFACGNGENGIYAAKCGAEVIGIDISPEGVENANKNAKEYGVGTRCKFMVMDGENMTFADNVFDVAVEYGALHHVDLNAALKELSRVLKVGAEMICVEALRHNPLIHAYRKRTPHLRTEWEVEHILGVEDLDTIKKYFQEVSVKYFHLVVLAAVPLRKTKLFKPVRVVLNKIDNWLLGSKRIGKFGWIMIITLSKPIK